MDDQEFFLYIDIRGQPNSRIRSGFRITGFHSRGIDLLLEAARELEGIKVVMAGKFIEPRLEEKAKSLPYVEFRGWLQWEDCTLLAHRVDAIYAFYDPSLKSNVHAAAQKWFE